MIDEVASIEAAEASLDAFIERRARDSKDGRSRANAEEEFWRARDRRQTRTRRLENAREWASHYGGLAYAFHDAAAAAAEKRDRALALVKELETDNEGGAAP